MRFLVPAILFILFTQNCWAAGEQEKPAQIIRYEAKGNLESLNTLGCISIGQVKNTYTPADLFKASIECAKQKKYQQATDLYATAGAYGHFDKQRVSDKTARQAITVLIMNNMGQLDKAKKEALRPYFDKLDDSKEMSRLCADIKTLGAPNYYPTYMIQHGITAFTKDNSAPLIKDFDAKKTWEITLDKYLHCK